MNGEWETVIGLEIHAQLATASKIFSGASTAYGAAPNTQACAVDLGLPGVLPVLNHEAVRMAIRFGVAREHVLEFRVTKRQRRFSLWADGEERHVLEGKRLRSIDELEIRCWNAPITIKEIVIEGVLRR